MLSEVDAKRKHDATLCHTCEKLLMIVLIQTKDFVHSYSVPFFRQDGEAT